MSAMQCERATFTENMCENAILFTLKTCVEMLYSISNVKQSLSYKKLLIFVSFWLSDQCSVPFII